MRIKYWSNSLFADWVRGTYKPVSLTFTGWDEWEKSAKESHPFRFWLADVALDKIQDQIYYLPDKIYAVKYYINNRWVTKTNALTAHPRDIKPGVWCDVGSRFLYCMFNELVDFIEIEQASHHIAWDTDARAIFAAPWWSFGWFKWRTWRCPEAGIAYLDWAKSLTYTDDWVDKSDPSYGQPTHQALAAIEIKELYTWWTVTRPARIDPYDASGWTEVCDKRRSVGKLFGGDETPEEREVLDNSLNTLHEIEAQYSAEDEEMMIRLIKIRDSLWT